MKTFLIALALNISAFTQDKPKEPPTLSEAPALTRVVLEEVRQKQLEHLAAVVKEKDHEIQSLRGQVQALAEQLQAIQAARDIEQKKNALDASFQSALERSGYKKDQFITDPDTLKLKPNPNFRDDQKK